MFNCKQNEENLQHVKIGEQTLKKISYDGKYYAVIPENSYSPGEDMQLTVDIYSLPNTLENDQKYKQSENRYLQVKHMVTFLPVDLSMDIDGNGTIDGIDQNLEITEPGAIVPFNEDEKIMKYCKISGFDYLLKSKQGKVTLKRENDCINVWMSSHKTVPLLLDKDEKTWDLSNDSQRNVFKHIIDRGYIYVEFDKPGSSRLIINYQSPNPEVEPIEDEIIMTVVKGKQMPYRQQAENMPYELISAEQLKNIGAGIRFNGDDDNGNRISDLDETGFIKEDDLIEVMLEVSLAPAPLGMEYFLKSDNGNLKVWGDRRKNTLIMDAGQEGIIDFEGNKKTIWVECINDVDDKLKLQARVTGCQSGVVLDEVKFYVFKSIIVGLSGETRWGANIFQNGMFYISLELYRQGYNVFYYDENRVLDDGSGEVYEEISNAIEGCNINNVAIYGHSHGGGATYDLSERLNNNRGELGTFNISFTGYIDAIENDSDIDIDTESRLPITTQYHVNLYQPNGTLHGGDVRGADVNLDVTTTEWGRYLEHTTIDENGKVYCFDVPGRKELWTYDLPGVVEYTDCVKFAKNTKFPIISMLADQKDVTNKGGTMRLGAFKCSISPNSIAFRAYQKNEAFERHRH